MKREKALNAKGDEEWRERARERTLSRAPRSSREASLGKPRRLTGMLKREISLRSQDSSPSGAAIMMVRKALAAALAGIELSGANALEVMLERSPAIMRGGRNTSFVEGEPSSEVSIGRGDTTTSCAAAVAAAADCDFAGAAAAADGAFALRDEGEGAKRRDLAGVETQRNW